MTKLSAHQPTSPIAPNRIGRRNPAERRAWIRHTTTSAAKNGAKNSALHFTPLASPNMIPATSSHHGTKRGARLLVTGSQPSSSARNSRRR